MYRIVIFGVWGMLGALILLPDPPGLGEALPRGSQSPDWLAFCHSETPSAQLVEWLAAHALSESKDLHLLSLAAGVCSPFSHIRLSSSSEESTGLVRALRSLLLSLLFVGTMCTMPPGKTLQLLLWPPLCKSCYHGLPRRHGPLPFVFSRTLKLAQARVHTLMPVTPTRTTRSGMPSLSLPPRGSILRNFGNSIAVGQSGGLC